MGMFDSFYFADGLLPENKAPSNHEFQTKDLECNLDNYHVAADGSVKKMVMNYVDGREEEKGPVNLGANVYSHEFLYDNEKDIANRKYLGCKYQLYKILIHNSKLIHAEKITEAGYATDSAMDSDKAGE